MRVVSMGAGGLLAFTCLVSGGVVGCGSSVGTPGLTGGGTRGGGTGAGGSGGGPGVLAPIWEELPEPGINVAGGWARATRGAGSNGGAVYIASRGALRIERGLPSGPPAPPLADGGTALGEDALASDVSNAGTIRLSGALRAGGTDPLRTITSTAGDIIVDGTLRGADLGTGTQAITLNAPSGVVFVSGRLDTGGGNQAAPGSAGGALTIVARDVVVTGRLTSAGSANESGAGGPGGAIDVSASGMILVTGVLDASGGDSRNSAGAATGGLAGNVRFSAGGEMTLQSKTIVRGGAAASRSADASGGNGGTLRIDADGPSHIGGTVDGRGGPAWIDGDGVATGGAAGAIMIGENAPPPGIDIGGGMVLTGGAGPERGGNGGPLTLIASGGDMRIAAAIDFSGGTSRGRPGSGGVAAGRVGPDAGGLTVAASVRGNGGSAEAGQTADGGDAGTLKFEVVSLTGPFNLEASGTAQLDGGASAGVGLAGGGGDLRFLTRDGPMSVAGKLLSRGGEAREPGGEGGLGGHINLYSDTNHDGIGGNLTVQLGGLVDASGGAGTIGGSARNDGGFGVAIFPDDQQLIAILLNTDTAPDELTNGELSNLGTVMARGGPSNGSGGDVVFHGRQVGDKEEDPLPGQMFVEGNGSGQPGEYWSQ